MRLKLRNWKTGHEHLPRWKKNTIFYFDYFNVRPKVDARTIIIKLDQCAWNCRISYMVLLQYRQPNHISLKSFCPQFLPCLLFPSIPLPRSSCGIIENNVSKDTHASPQLENDCNSHYLTQQTGTLSSITPSLSRSLVMILRCFAAWNRQEIATVAWRTTNAQSG